MTELKLNDLKGAAKTLRAGNRVLLSGTVYTARDAAHKRLFELLDRNAPLPFDIVGAVLYYTGPTPARGGMAVGSCGPTTAIRMDKFTPRLLDLGLGGIIGKGERGEAVCRALVRNGAVYFCAVGGAGALMATHVLRAEEIAFPELGCESVKRLIVDRFPVTVCIDALGGNIFKDERKKYAAAPAAETGENI
ncbi:MAG: FumA C-terminus/TtdB family hydratase beta subunit [Oscillospiraceae bacterium]|jgi:fumarate hydratase subunit beta|nr:FumA C-terminus/TtdB family hydratase beta subunit [Oscillospiraceae bacterium]